MTSLPERPIDAMIASLEQSLVSSDGVAPPVAVLWTDGDGQWAEFVGRLGAALPNLFTLGMYDPDRRTGPAIWLRCIVDRTLPEVWPATAPPPILYLPRVERQQLRAGGDCPRELQPLVELQYRGTVWHQRSGRDWTVDAFLTSADGCNLELARDQQTKMAALRVLPQLADVPLGALRGRRLTADDFDRLAVPDHQRDLLVWMHDPPGFRASHSDKEWTAFRNLVKATYGVDPGDDGVTEAARCLLEGSGQWAHAWQRFCEAPQRYRGIGRLLREPLAGQGILVDRSKLPLENEDDEKRLRRELQTIADLPYADACHRVVELEEEHGARRNWVWRHLDESPYAEALQPLARLAEYALKGVPGGSVEEMALAYATSGWRCDDAALAALSETHGAGDYDVVADVIRATYLPWLDKVARHFQDAVARAGGHLRTAAMAAVEPGTCLLFADGLRLDLAARLQGGLEARGVIGRMAYRIGAVPSVTATSKPLATPIVNAITGGDATDFTPCFRDTGQPVTAPKLREHLMAAGVELLDIDEPRMPLSESAVGWVEVGRIDELGHTLGDGLVYHLDREVDRLQQAVFVLLNAGWRRVRVVTDHGWLLLPGGLPKIDLPQYLVASRWARCATVREGATPQLETYSWYWNPGVRIASPPGAGAYIAGTAYGHGGLSPQECVVPDLTFERGNGAVSAKITKIEWKRMRCVVTVATSGPPVQVDVRSNWKQAVTSLVVSAKTVGESGVVSLAVRDEFEGQAVMVVVCDSKGQVLDKRNTIVGGE
jgi:hypothetical protein